MNQRQLGNSIRNNEGFSAKPYIDPIAKKSIPKEDLEIIEKHWDDLNISIGYGTNLQTRGIDRHEATRMTLLDIDRIEKELLSELPFFRIAPDHVQNVLIEMAYQMGVSGLLKFKKTLEHISDRNYILASAELLDSKWYKQTPQRALKLSNLMKGGF